MNLGEKITHLRKQKGLSQDALAHELNVSRQSVSKWETGASVPELEKLVALCDLFQISLDELVRDTMPQSPPPPPQTPPPAPAAAPRTQHIVGTILLFIGLLLTALGLVCLRNAFMLGLILVVYGAICLLVKKHAGLVICWITMAPILLLHRDFTGIRLFSVLNPGYYNNVATMAYIIAWLIWLALLLLVIFTWRAMKKK